MATEEIDLNMEGVERYDALAQQIQETFLEFHTQLDRKQFLLLERVKEMKELFYKYLDLNKAINQLEDIKRATNEMLTENLIAENKGEVVSLWDDKIANFKSEKSNLFPFIYDFKLISNSVEIMNSINKIHLGNCGVYEYSYRREPIVMKGKRGVGEGEIASPRGVAVDKGNGLIYIVDFITKIVSIFSLEGDFLKNFGKGKLRDPHGICLSEEFVFVTNRSNSSITKFLKSGHFVNDSKFANPGLQLALLSSLCTHNDYVYVCNRAKHRIELFNCDLIFIKSFGEGKFHCPEDIKINNGIIFILSNSEQIIYAFSADLEFISTISLTGQNCIISIAFFFTIDLNGNFIISDLHAGRLEVFSPSGEYIDSLGDDYLTFPGGICIDGYNRIVTVSQSDINSIQIY